MRIFLLIISLLFPCGLIAQITLSGRVVSVQQQPLQGVTVVDKISGKWAFTNDKGEFSISVYKEYDLSFTMLGLQSQTIKGTATLTHSISVIMQEETLRLNEVVVTATKVRDKVSSAVVLNNYAIGQFQSFSVSDILQQLPGQTIEKPSFFTPNILNLRTAIKSDNNAFGISYIIDDMPLSNDENMQTYSKNINTTAFSRINTGMDLRTIPASSIEKVEVITGIADAKYGNATTGLVVIDRKAGVYPLQVSASMIGGGNAVSVNKGFKISDKVGNLSLSLDYLNANADPRNNLDGYNRVTLSSIWSVVSPKNNFRNTFNLTLRSNIDGNKTDKEQVEGFRNSSNKKDYGLTFSNRLGWQFSKKWIDQLNLTFGLSVSKQDDYKEQFINNGGEVVPTATTTALHEGLYTPVAFRSLVRTIGLPFSINSQLGISKHLKNDNFSQNISAGIGFLYNDNLGEGKVFDSSTANTVGTVSKISNSEEGVRPLNFNKYVIANKLLSVYLQDNFQWQRANRQLLVANIGLRYENQNGYSSLSPRMNMAYEFTKYFKLRGGVGLATKAPSLANRFPGNVHFDILLRDDRTNHYAVNRVQTYVEQRRKVDLKPSKAWKYELGTDVSLKFMQLNLTTYLNKTFDAFTSETTFKLYDLPKLTYIPSADPEHIPPTYRIDGYEKVVRTYSTATNGSYYTDKGVELILFFNKIDKINTQFSLSGSYVFSSSTSRLPYISKTNNTLEEKYVYGYYPTDASQREQMHLRLTATHHISSLGLLFSLTVEQFTFSNNYIALREIYPYAYMDKNLVYHEIPAAERTHSRYKHLFLTPNETKTVHTPTYHNFHLRITKEMLNGLSISLYANNFLNYRPKITVNGHTSLQNSKISFGGSVKYQF